MVSSINDISLENLIADLAQLLQKEPSKLNSAPLPTSSFGQSVLARAQADLGVREDLGKNDGTRIREYFKPFNMEAGQDWCAAAISTWMQEAGGGPVVGGVGARNMGIQFRQAGRWVPRNEITSKDLTPGNIVVWARGGIDSWKGHIGVIESSDNNSFISIEANSGPKYDAVVRKKHSIQDPNLLGVGILSNYVPKKMVAQIVQDIELFALAASKSG